MQKLAKILIAVLKQHCNSSNPELKFPPFQLSCNLMQEWYIFARSERLETGRQQVITKINWNHNTTVTVVCMKQWASAHFV